VVCLHQLGGVAGLLHPGRDADSDGILAFGLLDETCTEELVLGGMHELLARTIHEEYVRTQTARGETAASLPALVPWEQLPERYRESNRHQADHIGIKLAAVACEVTPLTEWDAPARFAFDEPEIEKLARLEHDRWFHEWTADGWTLGPRAPGRTTNPYLVAWEELPAEVQEWDRGYVRGLPAFLARAGLQIRRLQTDDSGAPRTAPPPIGTAER
jgi:hypothetical protein